MKADKLVALCAVGVVTVASLGAALVAGRQDPAQAVVAGAGPVDPSANQKDVVTAPPLKTPAAMVAQNSMQASSRTATNAMGAAPVCRDCGVVQIVVAVYEHGEPRPNGFQMHIRMDDGRIRTVQQRGALAAGSRVMVDGETVHVLAEHTRPG
jgi:hypothetical protein